MPRVAPVKLAGAARVGIGQDRVLRCHATDHDRAGSSRRGVVGYSERECLQALRAGLGDCLNIGHPGCGFDQGGDGNGVVAIGLLNL